MIRIHFLLTFSLALGTVFCHAQSDSTVQAGAEKKSSQHLYLFNKTSNSSVNFSTFTRHPHSYGSFSTENLHLKNHSSDDVYFNTDCPLYLRKGEYEHQWGSVIDVHYFPPSNPNGATSAPEALIMGSFFFILDQLFPEK